MFCHPLEFKLRVKVFNDRKNASNFQLKLTQLVAVDLMKWFVIFVN